jgi:CRP-like cAMP-binding protein
MASGANGSSGNNLLDLLNPSTRRGLLSEAELKTLPVGEILFRQGEPIEWVHFPVTAVLSLVTRLRDGTTIESSTLGSEGTTAVPVFLGVGSIANAMCIAQVAGDAWRISSASLRRHADGSAALRDLLSRYTHALLVQVGQAVACSRLHPTVQRCARWLLMTQDRVGSSDFHLTQEFLAYMLGVRRVSVTDAVAPLRRAGVIAYHRGEISIKDREALEHQACECYEVMRGAFRAVELAP